MCDLSDTESFEDIVTALKNYLEKNQIDENGMIFATGYDHNFLAEQKHPDKTVLDKVSKTVPIFTFPTPPVHMGVAPIRRCYQLAGITTETKDPEGGRFGRDKSGEPDGYVEETPALMQVLAAAMPRMKMDMVKQMKAAQQLYLKYGITTVQEGAAQWHRPCRG
ncbi:MAG: amidohydrolase family protein [Lachnospira sp.]